MSTITVQATPDSLVKVYDQTDDQVCLVENTNDDGVTPPVTLKPDHDYCVEITFY